MIGDKVSAGDFLRCVADDIERLANAYRLICEVLGTQAEYDPTPGVRGLQELADWSEAHPDVDAQMRGVLTSVGVAL